MTVVPRQNDNRARAKSGRSRIIPASAALMRLYSDYLHREYGALDADYVSSSISSPIRMVTPGATRPSMTWCNG